MSTRAELLGCVEREVHMRERAYPRWIEQGRMTKEKADRELLLMREVHMLLERHLPPDHANQTEMFR